MCKLQYLHVATYVYITIEQNINFKQNIKKNRLKIKELLERKIGKKKSKIGSSLGSCVFIYFCNFVISKLLIYIHT